MKITIDIDPQGNGQIIYSPDLDQYLQINLIAQTILDNQKQDAQAKIVASQKVIDDIALVTSARIISLGLTEPTP